MAERVLRVWLLSDGRAGHYNQSRGIVQALQTVQPVETVWIDVRLRLGLVRTLLRWRLNRAPHPVSLKLLKLCCRISKLSEQRCDVIVSAGGKTSFANAWLAAAMQVPNIYVGSLRRLDAALFSAVLTLEPVAGAPGNLQLQLPPSPIEPAAVETAGAKFRTRLGSPEQRYWTLLLGGDGAGYRYHRKDWLALRQLLENLSDHYGVRWLIASSRRTGSVAERLLREGAGDSVASACWYADGDVFRIEEFLGAAESVFVTEDSMTMLTEAMHAQRPVHSLAPRQAAPDDRFSRALQRFEQQRWLCRHGIDALLSHPERISQQPCRPLSESPLVALGERLGRVIFQSD